MTVPFFSDAMSPPSLTAGLPGIGGRIKSEPEDFEVEEIPAYEPSGEGDHLFLWVQKRDIGAEFFQREVSRRLRIDSGELGTAGLKDRRAVTRQWISVPARVEAELGALDGDGITVLKTSRHANKLKSGHLIGNRFRILIRDVVPDSLAMARPILDRLQTQGFPNFFGSQRFGRDGETAELGFRLLAGTAGKMRSGFLRKLALSAAQSVLFNAHLARRMNDGLFRTVLDGDVMSKHPRGGLFVVEDVTTEQHRFDARETVITGPIYGKKTFAAEGQAAARETMILTEAGLTGDTFNGFGKLLQGTRRPHQVYVDDLMAEPDPVGIRLSFTLPAGSYATVLLSEVMKCPVPE